MYEIFIFFFYLNNLQGNFFWVGDFQTCINTQTSNYTGQYCIASQFLLNLVIENFNNNIIRETKSSSSSSSSSIYNKLFYL